MSVKNPELVYEPRSMEEVRGLYEQTNSSPLLADQEIEQAVIKLKNIRIEKENLSAEEAVLLDRIASYMKDREMLVSQDGVPLVTFKMSSQTKTFDMKSFRLAHKDLYENFLQVKDGTRRFLLK